MQKTGKIKNVRNIHAHIQPTPACDAIQSSDDIRSVSDSISSGVTFHLRVIQNRLLAINRDFITERVELVRRQLVELNKRSRRLEGASTVL